MLIPDRVPLPEQLTTSGLMAIIRSTSAEAAEASALSLARAGIRMLEISFTTPGAAGAIRRVRDALPVDVLVGAGTVLNRDDASEALGHGAEFLVSPGFDAAVADLALEARVGYYPGALSPTEVLAAWRAGATAVKVFPAGTFGLDYFRALREPLPHIELLAVGGVSVEHAPAFLSAGAVAVGLGGALSEPDTDLPSLIATLSHAVGR